LSSAPHQNVIERAVILSPYSTIEIDPQVLSLPQSMPQKNAPVNLQDRERLHLLRVGGAAAQFGLNPSTLRSRIKRLGLKRPVAFM
jgi:formate hydrogenlyase transcriptional activator